MIQPNLPSIFPILVSLCSVLLLVGCETLQSVDQGLYNIAESVSEEDRVTGQRSLSLESRSQQIAKGNAVVDQLLKQEQQNNRKTNQQLDKAQYWRMIEIFDRIHRISHLRDERWQPVLIDRDSFNAFTTGGTYVVVHLGLMQQLSSDDEVAAVLAHEIAHTVANHVFEGQSLAQATALANSNSSGRKGYQAAFTHENEREADRIGVLYSALSGYDPMAASRIWKRQFEASGNRRAFFFHDHPVNSEREQENRQVGQKVERYYRAGQTNPNYVSLLSNNVLWQNNTAAQSGSHSGGGSGEGLTALTSTLFGAYQQHLLAKQGEQQQLQQIQLVRYVQSQLTIVQESRPANNRWRLTFEYAGQIPLRGITMGGQIPQGKDSQGKEKAPQIMVSHLNQPLKTGSRFTVEFRHQALVPITQPRKSVKLYLDDALPQR